MSPTLDPAAPAWTILVRFSGDISTKARPTKQRFTSRLTQNVADALRSGGIGYRIRRDWDRLHLRVDSPAALDVLQHVFGIQSITFAEERSWSRFEDLIHDGEAIFREHVRGKRFAVRARRCGNVRAIPFSSFDVERELGTNLLRYASGVDLSHPEAVAGVDVHLETAFFYREKAPGPGGLPVGVGGRALALVSGGFDSAVAAWLLQRRGIAVQYLFFNLGGEAHRRDVLKVTKVLADHWSYGVFPMLYEVDFQDVVREIREKVAPRYWQVVLKRQMLRAAEPVARRARALALVTGDAVGQVSSQTLKNIAVISAAARMPVLRPLVASNKEEIIEIARRIGTYELSAGVEEYCAILAKNPSTHASLEAIETQEASLDLGRLEALAADPPRTDLRRHATPRPSYPDLEVEAIDEGSVAIDLRSRIAYDAWHYPDALHLDFTEAQKAYPSFARRPYVFYCEVGLKSAHLAEKMREAGFDARHVKDGVKTLLRRRPAEVELLLD